MSLLVISCGGYQPVNAKRLPLQMAQTTNNDLKVNKEPLHMIQERLFIDL